MMQIHQGIDIVEIGKFKKVFSGHKNFVSDVFTRDEQDYCLSRKEPHIHFAGRFAAKEAGLKALGIGLSGVNHVLKDIEVKPDELGKPVISFTGWAKKISRKKGIRQLTVSISHSANYAVATVILVGDKSDV